MRQVHLDFHTSPFIPDVSVDFDAAVFAKTFKNARVNSVTIFAKCHHGQCYYPTKTGIQHPATIGRDLLGEMIEALHREGIRCPIYTTVGWEEDVAHRFPQWRQMRRDGTFAEVENSADGVTIQPGRWKFNNFLHPDYQDYIEAHVEELLTAYEVDGLFFDIVFFESNSCWSEASRKFRAKHGFLHDDADTQMRFESAAQEAFAKRFTAVVHRHRKNASVFYNASNTVCIEGHVGVRSRFKHQTHAEIESLPSGMWGYYHFPRVARAISHWGKPWIAQTGRFQRMWGDFGGIKPQAALEFECFRSQALGGGNSVGDQLAPRGRLEKAVYNLIGAVYAQCEMAEPFYKNSIAIPEIGILTACHPSLSAKDVDRSMEGAVTMAEETHYDAAVLDETSDLTRYRALVLCDSTIVTPALLPKLRAYYLGGGKLIISHRAGFGSDGEWALDFLPMQFHGEVEKYPTYWCTTSEFMPEFADTARVIYQRGLNVTGGSQSSILVHRILPYFQRSDLKFCSHFQAPPLPNPDVYPAVIGGAGFVYFADPIFNEYRKSGNAAVRLVWQKAVERLIGPPLTGRGLPTTVSIVPRRRGEDLILTLLHYIPVRKCLDIDVIEERMNFANLALNLPSAEQVRVFPTGEILLRDNSGSFVLPSTQGRLLLEVPNYFNTISV